MHILSTPESRVELSRALDQMADSLRILDELHVPGEVGAMLDLAIARLEAALKPDKAPTQVCLMIDRLEEELSIVSAEPDASSAWENRPV